MTKIKSVRLKFSIIAFSLLCVFSLFAKPPVINKFFANRYEGFNPMCVKFTVDAYDPEGDTLSYTFHIFDQNGNQTDIISETGTIIYTFTSYGNYTVRVSVFGSHGEFTESKALSFFVKSYQSPISLSLLTSSQLKKILNGDTAKVSVKTHFFNNTDSNLTIHIKGYKDGELVVDTSEKILPNETFSLLPHYFTVPITDVVVSIPVHIPVYSDIYTTKGRARAWYRYDNTTEMYMPYIEENAFYRESYAFISNPFVKPVAFTYNQEITELPKDLSILLNAGSFVHPFSQGAECWGMIKDEIIQTLNPGFVEEKTLNGLGINIDYDQNISLYELKSNPSTTLYLPFIPHVDCYNDLILLNKEDRESEVTIYFYDNHGLLTGQYNVVIPAKERVKLYLETIISDLGINADSAIVKSIQPIYGVNVVKIPYGGVYAFALQTYDDCKGYSPVVMDDDYYWTALSLMNTNNQEITITFNLYTASGKFKASESITVPPFGLLQSYVSDIFEGIEVNNGDSIVIRSSKPISGLTLQGTNSLTRLSALPIF